MLKPIITCRWYTEDVSVLAHSVIYNTM